MATSHLQAVRARPGVGDKQGRGLLWPDASWSVLANRRRRITAAVRRRTQPQNKLLPNGSTVLVKPHLGITYVCRALALVCRSKLAGQSPRTCRQSRATLRRTHFPSCWP